MKTFFENEQMEAARVLAEQIHGEIDPAMSVKQNMVRSLQMRTTDVDAETVVNDLCEGIASFHKAYEDAKAQGLEAMIAENLDKILEGMEEEQQKALLMGILKSCAEASGAEVPEGMTLETMKQSACYCIGQFGLALTGSEAFEQMAQLDEEALNAITEATANAQEEEYVALAMYLLQTTGEMENASEEMNAQQIGAMTAATLAAHSAVAEAAEAETENETEEQTEARFAKLKKALKLIGGALAIALIAAVAAASIMFSSMVLFTALGLLCYSTTFVQFLAMAGAAMFGVCGVNGSIEFAVDNVVKVAERSGLAAGVVKAYRVAAEFVTETVIPAAKRFWTILRKTVTRKINQFRGVDADYTVEVDEEIVGFDVEVEEPVVEEIVVEDVTDAEEEDVTEDEEEDAFI